MSDQKSRTYVFMSYFKMYEKRIFGYQLKNSNLKKEIFELKCVNEFEMKNFWGSVK